MSNVFEAGPAPFEKPDTPAHVLKGPADADHYRIKVGRFNERWYTDPLPGDDIAPALPLDDGDHDGTRPVAGQTVAWPSISAIKNASGKDWSFISLRRVAKALEERPNALSGLDFDERLQAMNGMNRRDLRAAQDRGTNVHWYMECGLRGLPIVARRPNEPGIEYLDAVRAWFATYKPRLLAAEVVFIHRDLHGYGYGGTGDAVVEIDGQVLMLDWKSRGAESDHGAYPEEAAQVSGYAGAQYMIVEGPNGPTRQAIPAFDGGLIVSIKPDGMREYPVDLSLGWKHFESMHAWWTARRTEKAAIGRPWAPRKPVVGEAPTLFDLIAAADSDAAMTAIWNANRSTWTPDHSAAAQSRLATLR